MNLGDALAIDLVVVIGCVLALVLKGGLRLSHPGVLYLAFHLLVFSFRANAVRVGAPAFLNASEAEFVRALLLSDVFLVSLTAGMLSVRVREPPPVVADQSKHLGAVTKADHEPEVRYGSWAALKDRYVLRVVYVAMPIGLLTFARFAFIPGVDRSDSVAATAYATLPLTWPGLLLVILIYRYGFRLMLMAPMSLYLTIMAVQGYGRFRLVLPLILLGLIWLDRRDQRWPRLWMVTLFAGLALIFFPLKDVGSQVQAGIPYSEVEAEILNSFSGSLSGQSDDQTILDQLAITVSLAEAHGGHFWGRPYLSLLTLPVPRVLWPEKPGLADHIAEISTPYRPLSTIGGVTTMVGDLYLNFWLFGITIVAFVLGRWGVRAYHAAYRRPFLSVQRLAYLLLVASLVQFARDGLLSIPVFLLVQNLPLMVIIFLHYRPAGATRPKPGRGPAPQQQRTRVTTRAHHVRGRLPQPNSPRMDRPGSVERA